MMVGEVDGQAVNSAVAIADTARTIEQFNDGYKVAFIDGAKQNPIQNH